MRFVLFVEGHTEKKIISPFLKRWLDARLDQRVCIKVVRFEGWSEMVKDLAVKTRMHLRASSADQIIAVIALPDLYGPTIYPDRLTSARARMNWAIKYFEGQVDEERFRMFFAVHEIEAWLLSDPGIFPPSVARAFPDKVKQPESVNFNEPPAKLLAQLYSKQRKRYKKPVDGSILFKKLNPDRVYEKCPVFKRMMDEMLVLAKNAGL